MKARNITVNATMEIDSLDAISSMVREGLGVSIVPICKGKRAEWEGARAVPFGDPPFVREVGALIPSTTIPDALILAFLKVLQAAH